MSDYFFVDFEVKVKKTKIPEIRKGLEDIAKENWFLFPGMIVTDEGWLELPEYFVPYSNQQDEYKTYHWLKNYLGEGYINFDGTSSDMGFWRIFYDGIGGWKEQIGKVVYEDKE